MFKNTSKERKPMIYDDSVVFFNVVTDRAIHTMSQLPGMNFF